MSVSIPPANPVTFRGLEYRLEDDLTVSSPRPSGNKNGWFARMDRVSVHGEVMTWLADHAVWLDRSEEIASAAIARYRTEPLLRSKLNLESPALDWEPPWLHIGDMPRVPERAAKVLGRRGMPATTRRTARKQMSGYQRSHARWMIAEADRCAELRERLLEGWLIDKKFDEARRSLQAIFDRGAPEDTLRVQAILTEAIRNLSALLAIERLDFSGADGLTVDIACKTPEAISPKRHVPQDTPFRLIVLESESVRTDRLVLLGHAIALTIADLAGLLRTARRTITLRLWQGRTGADDPVVFSTRFDAGHVLAAADRITEAVAQRKRPEVSGWDVEISNDDATESQT